LAGLIHFHCSARDDLSVIAYVLATIFKLNKSQPIGRKMRPLRVALFSIAYFTLFVSYIAFLMLRTLASAEPDALIWYLTEYSLGQLITLFLATIGRSPMMILSFLYMLSLALLFGFLTELLFSWLRISFVKLLRLVSERATIQ